MEQGDSSCSAHRCQPHVVPSLSALDVLPLTELEQPLSLHRLAASAADHISRVALCHFVVADVAHAHAVGLNGLQDARQFLLSCLALRHHGRFRRCGWRRRRRRKDRVAICAVAPARRGRRCTARCAKASSLCLREHGSLRHGHGALRSTVKHEGEIDVRAIRVVHAVRELGDAAWVDVRVELEEAAR